MKILIVSMRSIHTIRWVSQLENSGHEVFYFDILNGGYIKEWPWVRQYTDWRYKFGDFKGRYLLKKYLPKVHKLLENKVSKAFEKVLQEFQPDAVHSFALFLSCTPIFEVMKENNHIKWIYSAWGNDLYFLRHKEDYKKDILEILPHIDYMFADCKRDLKLAEDLGFKGKILGDFPGGGGYHLDIIDEPLKTVEERKYIIVKGYHGEMHRGLVVLKALEKMKIKTPIVIFSADDIVYNYYIKSSVLKEMNVEIYKNSEPIAHKKICELMNASLIYIGNNLTDGMPNTLLESICFGAFPIQSNPGGASEEIIENGVNGLIINDCDDVLEIESRISEALNNTVLLKSSFEVNKKLRERLAFDFIRDQVLKKYQIVEEEL